MRNEYIKLKLTALLFLCLNLSNTKMIILPTLCVTEKLDYGTVAPISRLPKCNPLPSIAGDILVMVLFHVISIYFRNLFKTCLQNTVKLFGPFISSRFVANIVDIWIGSQMSRVCFYPLEYNQRIKASQTVKVNYLCGN